MSCPFKEGTLPIIKKTAPVVAPEAQNITKCFYGHLFEDNPQLKSYFNQTHQATGTQPRALAASVVAYALNIEELGNLKDAVELIAEKHVAYQVQAEQYPIVGSTLLRAINEVLGVDGEILDAWGDAYGVLADIFIKREAELYEEKKERCGFSGMEKFTVENKEVLAGITTLYLRHKDGKKLDYDAGQYVCLQSTLKHDDGHVLAPRTYSVSSYGKDYIRLGCLNEGIVSGWIHDELKLGDEVSLSPPCGVFRIRESDLEGVDTVVLVGAGIGSTPLVAMLQALDHFNYQGQVKYIQSNPTKDRFYAGGEIVDLIKSKDNFSLQCRYTKETEVSEDYEALGRMTAETLKSFAPNNGKMSFYACGPSGFEKAVRDMVEACGYTDATMFSEVFAPELE